MAESQQRLWYQSIRLLESASFPAASSYNMLKRLLVIYDKHDKAGLCFKAYILFPDFWRSIVYYILFNQEDYFIYKISYIFCNSMVSIVSPFCLVGLKTRSFSAGPSYNS